MAAGQPQPSGSSHQHGRPLWQQGLRLEPSRRRKGDQECMKALDLSSLTSTTPLQSIWGVVLSILCIMVTFK